jgi:hypothetical protein
MTVDVSIVGINGEPTQALADKLMQVFYEFGLRTELDEREGPEPDRPRGIARIKVDGG